MLLFSLLNRIFAKDEADDDGAAVVFACTCADVDDGEGDAWRREDRSLRIEDAAARMASAACACSLLTCRDVDVDDVATSLSRNGERGVDEDKPTGEESLYLEGDCGTMILGFSARLASALVTSCFDLDWDCIKVACGCSCPSSFSPSDEEVSLADA